MREKKKRPPVAIAPENLYPFGDFKRAAKIGDTTMRRARSAGVELRTLSVGRNLYVRGVDGIEFLEACSKVIPRNTAE